ncbi:MAG: septum formation initiator family protein [Lachnospiraceae bacterium]|nr:septum formation initiator family protein [Lachnospiraceae bacterium]
MTKFKSRTRKKPFVAILVVFLLVMMSIQMASLYGRYDKYRQKEASLNSEVKSQEEKKQDLLDYENYTKSDKYVENTAKSKLGLVYENETIFREH